MAHAWVAILGCICARNWPGGIGRASAWRKDCRWHCQSMGDVEDKLTLMRLLHEASGGIAYLPA